MTLQHHKSGSAGRFIDRGALAFTAYFSSSFSPKSLNLFTDWVTDFQRRMFSKGSRQWISLRCL